MFTYADVNYYCNEYAGDITDKEKIKQNLLLASCDINRVTFNRIIKIGFDNLSNTQQELIKRACCIQADYCYNGIGNEGSVSSYSAGNVSVSYDTTHKSVAEIEKISDDAYKLLKATGLTHRCI